MTMTTTMTTTVTQRSASGHKTWRKWTTTSNSNIRSTWNPASYDSIYRPALHRDSPIAEFNLNALASVLARLFVGRAAPEGFCMINASVAMEEWTIVLRYTLPLHYCAATWLDQAVHLRAVQTVRNEKLLPTTITTANRPIVYSVTRTCETLLPER